MTNNEDRDRPARSGDVRLQGFSDRASLEQATDWIDAHATPLPGEDLELGGARGRILVVAVTSPRDIPSSDRAAENGYALRAAETAGAADYNPLYFVLAGPTGRLPVGAAALVASGAALPVGADAIMPFEAAQRNGALLEVFGAVAPGRGVERQGQHAGAGTVLIGAGRSLRAQDLGLLASLGLARVRVVRQPRIKLILAGPKPTAAGASYDADGPMLCELVRRDGGVVSQVIENAASRAALVEAMAEKSVDAILVIGRTGTGEDDEAPLALAEVGELAIHGVALRPGGSAGMGLVGGVPVLLLPGEPLACLGAYEMLAGRLIRRLAARNPELPHLVREAEVGRKIVSEVGSVDLCQVRFVGGGVEPTGSAESGGLASAVRAEGFVVVAAQLEGYAPGAQVSVRLYNEIGAVRSGAEEWGKWPTI